MKCGYTAPLTRVIFARGDVVSHAGGWRAEVTDVALHSGVEDTAERNPFQSESLIICSLDWFAQTPKRAKQPLAALAKAAWRLDSLRVILRVIVTHRP